MATITLELDDQINAELEEHCAREGVDKVALIAELVRQRVERERAYKLMQDPKWIEEFKRLEAEGLFEVDPNEYAEDYAHLMRKEGR